MKTQTTNLNRAAINHHLETNNRKGDTTMNTQTLQPKTKAVRFLAANNKNTLRGLIFTLIVVLTTLSYAGAQQTDSPLSTSTREDNHGPISIVPIKGAKPPIADIGENQDSLSGNGINYYGGPVMISPHNAYYIWYGNWSGNSATTILPNFMSGLNGSNYFNSDTTYTQSNGQSVVNTLTMSSKVFDNYSLGSNLSDSNIAAIVNSKITSGQLPKDPNGVYFVLTSQDVNETDGFCTLFCGWHNHATMNSTDIKYAFVGNAARCPSRMLKNHS